MPESIPTLAVLRARLAERPVREGAACFGLGAAGIDARVALRRACLHEMVAEAEDRAALSGFARLLGARAADGRPMVWLRADGDARGCGRLHAPGLVDLGIDPGGVTLIQAKDADALMKAALDVARCDAAGSVVVEAAPRLDLTASRRLSLAAEASGVTILLARSGDAGGPSAARTRWRVSAAPSTPLEADAPGHPAFDIELLRDRGGCAPFAARLEWDRDRLAFREAPLPRGLAALPPGGAGRRAA